MIPGAASSAKLRVVLAVLSACAVVAESISRELIMNEMWFSDPFTISFEVAGIAFVALAFWFTKMDLQHRPKRPKKVP